MNRNAQGFTLIELIFVAAIIAVLAAIAIPQFMSYRIKVYNAAAESHLRNFRTQMESHRAETQAYPVL